MLKYEEKFVDLIMRDQEKEKDLLELLLGLPPSKKYLRWNGQILSLFLEFNLNKMIQFPTKIPSFGRKSRSHLRFDLQFAQFVVKRLDVEEEYNRNKLTNLLQTCCKTKYTTMKRIFNREGGEDYINLIPKLAQENFNKNDNPLLFRQLQQWKRIKDEYIIQQTNDQKSTNQSRRRKFKKTKKTKKITK